MGKYFKCVTFFFFHDIPNGTWFWPIFECRNLRFFQKNRCRFAVELESLGVLCLLPAQATQVDNKEMLLYIHYTKRFALFQGEKYSNRNKLSLLAGFVLVEKIAGKETRQQHVARFEDHLFPSKMRGYYGVRWGRLKKPVGPGQQFFPRHKNDPLKTETRRRAWAPQRSPLKSEFYR